MIHFRNQFKTFDIKQQDQKLYLIILTSCFFCLRLQHISSAETSVPFIMKQIAVIHMRNYFKTTSANINILYQCAGDVLNRSLSFVCIISVQQHIDKHFQGHS